MSTSKGNGGGSGRPHSLCACLAYFREDPEWLERAVRSLSTLGVTHLVAADGAYAAFPDATAHGSAAEREAIQEGAEAVGIQAEVFAPQRPWATEMDKRSWLFARSRQLGADWHLVFDADYLVAEGFDLKPTLQHFDADVGVLTLRHHIRHGDAMGSTVMPMPMLFRAVAGLCCEGHHANYVTGDGRCFWGFENTVPRVQIEGVTVDHLACFRESKRLQQAKTYYQHRDELGLEMKGGVA